MSDNRNVQKTVEAFLKSIVPTPLSIDDEVCKSFAEQICDQISSTSEATKPSESDTSVSRKDLSTELQHMQDRLASLSEEVIRSAESALSVTDLVAEAHESAVKHGFYERPKGIGTQIALVHSELSEALEAARTSEYEVDPNIRWEGGTVPVGVAIELADAVIRIADMCGWYGIDLENAIKVKMEYNKTRPYKHGKSW